MPAAASGGARWAQSLQRHWWAPQRSVLVQLLQPLAWIYGLLWHLRHRAYDQGWRHAHRARVPLVVVGNLVVGGAGKTPTVIALTRVLLAAGWRPGVISRGYGSASAGARPVDAQTTAAQAGDEPILIQRTTGVPVWVGPDRVAAAQRLLDAHPDVSVIISDDGLQHLRLARDLEVIVFDERGAGNGLLLPAGPLREPVPAQIAPPRWLLYNAAQASMTLPGPTVTRKLGPALALPDWIAGRREHARPLIELQGRPLLAAAGTAVPERFFSMLESAGLTIQRLPLPDHHPYTGLPWPASTAEVVITEKDAVKLVAHDLGATRVWVVGLDFTLPHDFTHAVLQALASHTAT